MVIPGASTRATGGFTTGRSRDVVNPDQILHLHGLQILMHHADHVSALTDG